MKSGLSILGIVCLVFAFVATDVSAQNITINNDLAFGDVFPGIPKTVSKKTAGSAAEYLISGNAGDEVTIDFTLPTYMNSGGYNMQMVFTDTDCALDSSSTPDQSNPGADNLDPWHTITYTIGSGGIRIWLGGLVIPKLAQHVGSYTGTIVLTVAKTGT